MDHAPTIKDFLKLLPGKAIVERYIATNKELSAKGDSALAIVKAFMKSERAIQKQIVELMGTKVLTRIQSSRVSALIITRRGTNRISVLANRREEL